MFCFISFAQFFYKTKQHTQKHKIHLSFEIFCTSKLLCFPIHLSLNTLINKIWLNNFLLIIGFLKKKRNKCLFIFVRCASGMSVLFSVHSFQLELKHIYKVNQCDSQNKSSKILLWLRDFHVLDRNTFSKVELCNNHLKTPTKFAYKYLIFLNCSYVILPHSGGLCFLHGFWQSTCRFISKVSYLTDV